MTAITTKSFPYQAMAVIWFFGAFASSFGSGHALGLTLLTQAGSTPFAAHCILWAGVAVDALMCGYAVLALLGITHRKRFWQVNLWMVILLTVLASFVAPKLWLDPFGAVAKNLGLIALCLVQAQLTASE